MIDWALTPNKSILTKKPSTSSVSPVVVAPPPAMVDNGNGTGNGIEGAAIKPAPKGNGNDKENTSIVKMNDQGHDDSAAAVFQQDEDEFGGDDDVDALEALAAADAETAQQTATATATAIANASVNGTTAVTTITAVDKNGGGGGGE